MILLKLVEMKHLLCLREHWEQYDVISIKKKKKGEIFSKENTATQR